LFPCLSPPDRRIDMAMTRDVVILIADDDLGHARLIEKDLRCAGLTNEIKRFSDGQEIIDFLFGGASSPARPEASFLLLLDIRMPKVDGVEVLRKIKNDPEFRKIPVSMLTTTDDPREVERCHALGCSNYLVKPVDYERFSEAMKQLGLFISLVQVPEIEAKA
jgi:CheY-like chemotaxis protein